MSSDATLRIKNLSISLKALSRINDEGSESLYSRIDGALREELTQLEKEQEQQRTVQPARPTTPDDDIPF